MLHCFNIYPVELTLWVNGDYFFKKITFDWEYLFTSSPYEVSHFWGNIKMPYCFPNTLRRRYERMCSICNTSKEGVG